MEQFKGQDNSPEKLSSPMAKLGEKDKKSKEKKKDDKLSRFERIQAALQRALESLLTSDSDKEQKQQKAKHRASSTAKDSQEQHKGQEVSGTDDVATDTAPTEVADSVEANLRPATLPRSEHHDSTAEPPTDSTWQRVRARVREFIRSKFSADDSSESTPGDSAPQPEAQPEAEPVLTDAERQQLTVAELEDRYRSDQSDYPSESVSSTSSGVVTEQQAAQPALITRFRQRRERRKQAKQLKRQQRQLEQQRRQIAKNTRHRETRRQPQPIVSPPVATSSASGEALHSTTPEQPVASNPLVTTNYYSQVNRGETRISYPPVPAAVEVEPVPPQVAQSSQPSPQVVEQPAGQSLTRPEATVNRQPVERVEPTSPQTAAEQHPQSTQTELAAPTRQRPPQSIGEIIRQRRTSTAELEQSSVMPEQRDRNQPAGSQLGPRFGEVSLAQTPTNTPQSNGNRPTAAVNKQPGTDDGQLRQPFSVRTYVGWWQQALLILINLVLIGLLVRELVL